MSLLQTFSVIRARKYVDFQKTKNELEDIPLEIIQSEQQRKKDFIETALVSVNTIKRCICNKTESN